MIIIGRPRGPPPRGRAGCPAGGAPGRPATGLAGPRPPRPATPSRVYYIILDYINDIQFYSINSIAEEARATDATSPRQALKMCRRRSRPRPSSDARACSSRSSGARGCGVWGRGGLIVIVYWPSRTEGGGGGASRVKLIWVRGFKQLFSNPTSWNTTSLNTQAPARPPRWRSARRATPSRVYYIVM